ncbi:hypothetical protein ACKWTF_001446 [Chironomus riparius]
MQVHKEQIDKVPNSLPNRSNIEIEIYGMEGIPAEDLKNHERQKNGNKSDSDDDEPTNKKHKLDPQIAMAQGMPPQMMMPNMVPNMAQFPPMMMPHGFQMMPGIQLMPHMMGHRPLFPAAAVQSPAMNQQKPTFPAYSNATISAPPKTNTGNSTSSNSTDTQKPPTIPQQNTGTASKIMHPTNDLSLEELKAKRPQYKVIKASTISPQISASITQTSTNSSYSNNKHNESKALAAAHEIPGMPHQQLLLPPMMRQAMPGHHPQLMMMAQRPVLQPGGFIQAGQFIPHGIQGMPLMPMMPMLPPRFR